MTKGAFVHGRLEVQSTQSVDLGSGSKLHVIGLCAIPLICTHLERVLLKRQNRICHQNISKECGGEPLVNAAWGEIQ